MGGQKNVAFVPGDNLLNSGHGPFLHVLKGFAAGTGHFHEMRLGLPLAENVAVILFNFRGGGAFPCAVVNFHEPFVGNQRTSCSLSDQLAGDAGAAQGTGVDSLKGIALEAHGGHAGLLESLFVQGNVHLALKAAFAVPVCLTMADNKKFHCELLSSVNKTGSGTSFNCRHGTEIRFTAALRLGVFSRWHRQ